MGDAATDGTGEPVVPDRPEVTCPWCGGAIPLAYFVGSDEESQTDVGVCPRCGRRVPLSLPL
jgi:endogenous inhibitor of DNA gyrase (YacG/DUF329 family)